MSEQQMANYTLTIQADSGYESTTEGRCTAEQYGQAMAALHGTSPAPRQPLPFSKKDMEGLDINQRLGFKLGWRSAEEAHGIKGDQS